MHYGEMTPEAQDCLGALKNNIAVLEELKKVGGVNLHGLLDTEIRELKTKAYKNGVEFFLKAAAESAAINAKKAEGVLDKAINNAEKLGLDISIQADAIRKLCSVGNVGEVV